MKKDTQQNIEVEEAMDKEKCTYRNECWTKEEEKEIIQCLEKRKQGIVKIKSNRGKGQTILTV